MKWVQKVAGAVGLHKWARREAVKQAETAIVMASEAPKPVGPIVVRRNRDMLRPGSVVVQDDRSYRVTKLLLVNKLGAFYEAEAE